MARALKKISDIAFDACDMIGDPQHRYHSFLMKRMAKGFQEMHLFMTPFVQVKTAVFSYSNVIEMPVDFVYETKVGVKQGDRIVTINRDYKDHKNQDRTISSIDCINYITGGFNAPDPKIWTPFYNCANNDVLYGCGEGIYSNSMYRVDYEKGTIELGSGIPRGCEIVVEYKTDGLIGGLCLVPSEMDKALESYGLKDYYKKKRDLALVADYKNEYDEQWFMLKELYQFKPIDYYARIMATTERGNINDLI